MKISLVILTALAACVALRHRSAALRHWILAAAIVCACAMPLVQRVVPAWPVGAGTNLLRLGGARAPEDARVDPADARERGHEEPRSRSSDVPGRGSSHARVASALGWVWIAGTVASLLVLLAGFVRLASLAARATPIVDGAWAEAARAIACEQGLSRPVTLLAGSHPGLLVTWGIVRPKILFPASALTWDAARIHVVLRHELAHVARGDWVIQLLAEALRAAYWFNPLTWLACRRLRHESERAADDAVLRQGVDASEYAGHLVDLARAMTHDRRTWAAAPAVARPSSLERRISAMLNAGLDREPISRTARLVCGTVVVTITAIVGSLVLAQGGARFSGSVTDPSGAPLPDTTISLTHRASSVTHAAPTDQAGVFSFATLPPGDYEFEARTPGFTSIKDTITLADGQSLQRDFHMNIGTVQETITISTGPSPRTGIARSAADIARTVEQLRGRRLQPPIKVKHVTPAYPPALRDAGVGGQVVVKARIATDGSVTDFDVVQSPHPELMNAALEAARQWRFEPTRLWGTPVEVGITMTFNFRGQQ